MLLAECLGLPVEGKAPLYLTQITALLDRPARGEGVNNLFPRSHPQGLSRQAEWAQGSIWSLVHAFRT